MSDNVDLRLFHAPSPASPPAASEGAGLLQNMQQRPTQSTGPTIPQSASAQSFRQHQQQQNTAFNHGAMRPPGLPQHQPGARQSLPIGIGAGEATQTSSNQRASARTSSLMPSYLGPAIDEGAGQDDIVHAVGTPPIGSGGGRDRRSASTFTLSEGASSDEAASYSVHSPALGAPNRSSVNTSRNLSHDSGFAGRPHSGAYDDLSPGVFGMPSQSSVSLMQDYSRYSTFRNGSSATQSAFLNGGDRAPSLAPTDSTDDLEGNNGQPNHLPYRSSFMPSDYDAQSRKSMSFTQGEMARAATTDALLWDARNREKDDYLHNPSPYEYKGRPLPVLGNGAQLSPDSKHFRPWSLRGIFNVFVLAAIVCSLVGVFAFWPIAVYVHQMVDVTPLVGWNIGGINATGQVPAIKNWPDLIDSQTPQSALTRTGFNGDDFDLVFSDEFNTDGRSFNPGDDPYWEAVDLNYWATHNYEWCDPSAITTNGGNLEITMTEEPIHNLNFKSGFLQSWNKFCFSGNVYIEINASLPGNAQAQGFWPGLWTMGNLGRAGYGATNDGTWPYSYSSCDVGTQANQTNTDGTTPTAAKTTGIKDYGYELSYLPGQRLSACTCDGDDHPGPSNNVGRGAPEIDLLEAQVDWRGYGTASQSVQIAPFDAHWAWDNTSTGWAQHNANTSLNSWKGSITQESASGVTILDAVSYNGAKYQTFGYEMQGGGSNGYITWSVGGEPTWTLYGNAFAPDSATEIGQRLISEEPMYILMNLFISSKFQGNPDFGRLTFPATFFIDYVRVYQKKGSVNIGCDPSSMPTAQYIQDHIGAYTNPNFTTWEQAGFEWPRNSRAEGGCSTQRAGP